MVIREGKITNCAALSIFLLTMSTLSQEQYNITISMVVNRASINAVAQYFYVHWNMIFIILWLFAIAKEVANQVSQLLQNIVIFIHCTLRNCFRNVAMALKNIPSMRHLLDKLFKTDYVRSTQCPQTSEIPLSQAAHLAASTKIKNQELEHGLQRTQNAPVNHRQLAQALHKEWYSISMAIFRIWLTQWDTYAIMWSLHEQGISDTEKWFPDLQWWGKISSSK